MLKKYSWQVGIIVTFLLGALAIGLLQVITSNMKMTRQANAQTVMPKAAETVTPKETFFVELHVLPTNGSLKIVGRTNLIEVGERIVFTLRSPSNCGYLLGILTCDYLEQDELKIADGRFETASFSGERAPVLQGQYAIELTYVNVNLHLRYEATTSLFLPLKESQTLQILLDNNVWCRYSTTEEC